jgi:hypothetical protein
VATTFEVIGAPQNRQSAGEPSEAAGEDDLLKDFEVPEGSLQQGSGSEDHDVPFN